MFGRQPNAQLDESLAATLLQLIENDAARRIGKSLEHLAHQATISKSRIACQGRLTRTDRGDGPMESPHAATRQTAQTPPAANAVRPLDLIDASPAPLVAAASAGAGVTAPSRVTRGR